MIFGYPYSSTIMEWRLRRVVPAAAVTTQAKPQAQQQLARDVEVERTAMGQRCRPQSSGPVSCVRQHASDLPSSRITSLLEGLDFTPAASVTTNYYENVLYFPDRVIFGYPYSSTIMELSLIHI